MLQAGNDLALFLYVWATQYPAVCPELMDMSGQNCSSLHSREKLFRTRGRKKRMGPRNHLDTVVEIKNTNARACSEPPLGRPICRGTLQWISHRNSRFTKYRWVCHIAGKSVHAVTAIIMSGFRLTESVQPHGSSRVRRHDQGRPYFIFCVEPSFVYILTLLNMYCQFRSTCR